MIPLLLLLLIKYFSQYIERLIDWSTLSPSEYVQLFFLKSLSVSNFHPFHFRLILYGLKITSPRTKACTQSLHPICVVPFLTQSLSVSLKMNKNTIGWSTVDPNKLYHVPKALKSSTILVKRLVVVLKVDSILRGCLEPIHPEIFHLPLYFQVLLTLSNKWYQLNLINLAITSLRRPNPNTGGFIVASNPTHPLLILWWFHTVSLVVTLPPKLCMALANWSLGWWMSLKWWTYCITPSKFVIFDLMHTVFNWYSLKWAATQPYHLLQHVHLSNNIPNTLSDWLEIDSFILKYFCEPNWLLQWYPKKT